LPDNHFAFALSPYRMCAFSHFVARDNRTSHCNGPPGAFRRPFFRYRP